MACSAAGNTLILASVMLMRIQAIAPDASQQRCSRNLGRYKLCTVCEAAIPALGMTFENCCSDRTAETACRFCAKNTRFCANLANMVQAGLQSFFFDAKDSQTSATVSDDARYGTYGRAVDYLELRRKESKLQRSVNLLPLSIVSSSLSKPEPFSITLDLYIQRERLPVPPRSNQSEEPGRGIAREITGETESGQPEIQSTPSTSNKTDTESDHQMNALTYLGAPSMSSGILHTNDAHESDAGARVESPTDPEATKRWGALGFSSWRKLSIYKHANNSKKPQNRLNAAPASSGRKRRSASAHAALRRLRKAKADADDGPDLELNGANSNRELNIDFDEPQVVFDGDEILKFLMSSEYKSHVIDRKKNSNMPRYKDILVRVKDLSEKSGFFTNEPRGGYSSEKDKSLRKKTNQQDLVYSPYLSVSLDNARTDGDLQDEKADIIIVDPDDEDRVGYFVESGPERDVVFSSALGKLRDAFQKRWTAAHDFEAEHGQQTKRWTAAHDFEAEHGQQTKRWGSLGAGKFRRWWMGKV